MGVVFVAIGLTVADEGPCFSHVTDNCDTVSGWSAGSCNSVYGGFRGNSNNLHRIIVDDFTDSMTYLLMASHFNTDVVTGPASASSSWTTATRCGLGART